MTAAALPGYMLSEKALYHCVQTGAERLALQSQHTSQASRLACHQGRCGTQRLLSESHRCKSQSKNSRQQPANRRSWSWTTQLSCCNQQGSCSGWR